METIAEWLAKLSFPAMPWFHKLWDNCLLAIPIAM